MMNEEPLNRFIQAQKQTYHAAFEEVESGRKLTHWMWYIFPQLKGLGFSQMSNYYELVNYFMKEKIITKANVRDINFLKQITVTQQAVPVALQLDT